ncbi:MAG: nuclear transport factor 2 family protein [Acidobacteriota bacterium]
MKKIVVLFSLVALPMGATSLSADDAAVAEIKSLIETSYVHGAFNELNPEAMERGFHPDFAIFSAKGEELSKYPIADWVAGTAERKASEDFDPAKNVWTHHFASVDVTGNAAAVKIELSKDGTLIFTDYLSLLKFDSGWRIAAKIYYRHPD